MCGYCANEYDELPFQYVENGVVQENFHSFNCMKYWFSEELEELEELETVEIEMCECEAPSTFVIWIGKVHCKDHCDHCKKQVGNIYIGKD